MRSRLRFGFQVKPDTRVVDDLECSERVRSRFRFGFQVIPDTGAVGDLDRSELLGCGCAAFFSTSYAWQVQVPCPMSVSAAGDSCSYGSSATDEEGNVALPQTLRIRPSMMMSAVQG